MEMESPTLETICSGRFGGCWGGNPCGWDILTGGLTLYCTHRGGARHYIVEYKLIGVGPKTLMLSINSQGGQWDS